MAPEPTGWTKIEPTLPAPVSFAVTLNAADTDGTVQKIWFHVEGTNAMPETIVEGQTSVELVLTQPGVSRVFFQAQDDDLQWSAMQTQIVRLDNSLPSICLNIPDPQAQKTPAEWWWNNTVSIAVIVTDNQDFSPDLVTPFPPELAGQSLVFTVEGAGQVATLTARDHAGHERVQASNTTLDVCGPGKAGRTVNIDTTAPAVTADLDDGPVYQSSVTVTLGAIDPPAPTDGSSSGVRYLDYSFDNFATYTRVAASSAPVGLSGPAALSFRTIDWAGNASGTTTRTYTINRPPTIVAPPAQVNAEGTVVTLLISASDPDGQALTYSASGLPAGLSINPATGVITGTVSYTAANTYTVTVSVSDGSQSDSETFTWVVTDANGAPAAEDDTAAVVQGQTVAITVLANDSNPDGTPLTVVSVTTPAAGSVVLNPDGTVSYTAPPAFVGIATFTYTVSDGALTDTATVSVNVLPGNLPPICAAAAATPMSLWPVNHTQVYVTVGGVVDPEGRPLSVTFTSILQDEPTNSAGQGNTMQDGGIEMNGTRAWVRAERSGTQKVPGDGRVYLIGFTATDAGGLSCTGTVRVGVPHDQRGTPAVLSAGRWNSLTGQPVP